MSHAHNSYTILSVYLLFLTFNFVFHISLNIPTMYIALYRVLVGEKVGR